NAPAAERRRRQDETPAPADDRQGSGIYLAVVGVEGEFVEVDGRSGKASRGAARERENPGAVRPLDLLASGVEQLALQPRWKRVMHLLGVADLLLGLALVEGDEQGERAVFEEGAGQGFRRKHPRKADLPTL